MEQKCRFCLSGCRQMFFVIILVLSAFNIHFVGCAGNPPKPDLNQLYSSSARHHSVERNPVILIPGVLGSKLVDTESGRLVWGAFAGGYANPQKPDGARLFALPMRAGEPLHSLRDSVESDGALESLKMKILGLPIEIGAYVHILGALGIGGFRDDQLDYGDAVDYGEEHFTCFQFDYDWRRDNSENAKLLHDFILEKRRYVQDEIKKRYGIANYDVKFDLVAHSMGALLARYYLRYGAVALTEEDKIPEVTWAGSKYVDRALLVAPPNAGSVDAIVQLVNGRKFGLLFPRYEPAILGTMPALYQLLPRERHAVLVNATDTTEVIENFMDPQFWIEMGWGLADPEQDKFIQYLLPEVAKASERRKIALDHLSKNLKRARKFAEALDKPASPPEGLNLYLIAGDALATTAVVAVDKESGHVKIIKKVHGDGTVLRSSALMDERIGGKWRPQLVSPIKWTQVIFVFAEHLEMTRDPAFTDNMLFLLLEQPRE